MGGQTIMNSWDDLGGQGRWREWIELSYVDYRGHRMRERVCRPRTRLQRLVPRSIVVFDDDGE